MKEFLLNLSDDVWDTTCFRIKKYISHRIHSSYAKREECVEKPVMLAVGSIKRKNRYTLLYIYKVY